MLVRLPSGGLRNSGTQQINQESKYAMLILGFLSLIPSPISLGTMLRRSVFFVQSDGFEVAYQVASMAITSAAMGEEVYVVLAFDALRSWVEGSWGSPQSTRETEELSRSRELGVMAPIEMLAESRGLGVKLLACETAIKLSGLSSEALDDKLDRVMGLPSIWKLTESARVLCL